MAYLLLHMSVCCLLLHQADGVHKDGVPLYMRLILECSADHIQWRRIDIRKNSRVQDIIWETMGFFTGCKPL
jgi:hypothetical protein